MAKNEAHSRTSDLISGSDLKLLFKGYLSHGPGGERNRSNTGWDVILRGTLMCYG